MTNKQKLKLKQGSNAKQLLCEYLWQFSFFCSAAGFISAPSIQERVIYLEITSAHSLHATVDVSNRPSAYSEQPTNT